MVKQPLPKKNFFDRVVQNTFFVSISKLLEVATSVAVIAILARHLSINSMGVYLLAIAIGAFFETAVNFGLMQLTVREISRNHHRGADIFAEIMRAQSMLILVFLILFGVGLIFIWPRDVLFAKCLILSILYQAVVMVYGRNITAVFQAYERMHWDTLLVFIYQLLIMVGVLYIVYGLKAGAVAVLVLFLSASIFKVAGGMVLVHCKMFRLQLRVRQQEGVIKYVAASWPMALQDIVRQGNARLGIVLIGLFSSRFQVALFTASMRIILRFRILVVTVLRNMLPEFSRQSMQDPDKMGHYFENSARWVFALGTAIAVVVAANGGLLAHLLLGGKYQSAAVCFEILSLFIPFLFFDILTVNILLAFNRQRVSLINAFFGFGVHFGIAMSVIPIWAAKGAALAFVSSFPLIGILNYRALCRLLPLDGFLAQHWMLPASGAITIFATFLSRQMCFVMETMVMLVLYVLLLTITRQLKTEDLRILNRLAGKLLFRRRP